VVEQCQEALPDVVYVAAGTLGTAVGLALGFALAGTATRVEAIGVTPAELRDEAVARTLAAETVSLLAEADTMPQLRLEDLGLTLREEFFAPGYGVPTPQTAEALRTAEGVGMHLETTYTGKAFSALLADARAGRLDQKRVLFWNTYSSAPYPEPGDIETLPAPLRDYIAECRRRYPDAGV
jgi:1-aminocyclopropane-1-carboxylate deaminase/D-cysteine desulfhydrase-like pyridoxal-dependent ACC family enzyme